MQRIALAIGNEMYTNFRELRTAKEDARCIGEVLGELGFEVDLKFDQTRNDFWSSVGNAAEKLAEGAVDMIFYYAGHGCSIGKYSADYFKINSLTFLFVYVVLIVHSLSVTSW